MDNNQQSSADHIIEHLKSIDVDGETMEYIVERTNLSPQLLRQLAMKANDNELNALLGERDSLHDRGRNTHFNDPEKTTEVQHRFDMIMDDINALRRFIHDNPMRVEFFSDPTDVCDEAFTHLNNIEIACDLSSKESLRWKKFAI